LDPYGIGRDITSSQKAESNLIKSKATLPFSPIRWRDIICVVLYVFYMTWHDMPRKMDSTIQQKQMLPQIPSAASIGGSSIAQKPSDEITREEKKVITRRH